MIVSIGLRIDDSDLKIVVALPNGFILARMKEEF